MPTGLAPCDESSGRRAATWLNLRVGNGRSISTGPCHIAANAMRPPLAALLLPSRPGSATTGCNSKQIYYLPIHAEQQDWAFSEHWSGDDFPSFNDRRDGT